jgi:hypothetical protein
MRKNKPYSIIYIQGYGHSGTTILDILLGSSPQSMSGGELMFITRTGIKEEFCSCGDPIGSCSFWSSVMSQWEAKSSLCWTEYKSLRERFEGNKKYLRVLANSILPSAQFKKYVNATELLYDAIFDHCQKPYIIDSSKQSTRPFILSRFAEIQLLHVCRNFTGVLNSEKKNVVLNLDKGIEKASPPKRTLKVLMDWVISNLTGTITTIRFKGQKVHFRHWLNNPEILMDYCPFLTAGFHEQDLKASHMLAGNSIRLKPPQKLHRGTQSKFNRLTRRQLLFGRAIDFLDPFWSK